MPVRNAKSLSKEFNYAILVMPGVEGSDYGCFFDGELNFSCIDLGSVDRVDRSEIFDPAALAHLKRNLAKYPGYTFVVDRASTGEPVIWTVLDGNDKSIGHEETVALCVEDDLKHFKTLYYGPHDMTVMYPILEANKTSFFFLDI